MSGGIEQFRNYCVCQDCGMVARGERFSSAGIEDGIGLQEPYCPNCNSLSVSAASRDDVERAGIKLDVHGEPVDDNAAGFLSDEKSTEKCPVCDGAGTLTEPEDIDLNHSTICPHCSGSGEVDI